MKKFSLKNLKFLLLSIVIIMSLFACKKDDDSNPAAPANASVTLTSSSVVMANSFTAALKPVVDIKNTGGSTLNSCTFTITVVTKANKTKDITFSVTNLNLAPNATTTQTLISTTNIPYNSLNTSGGVTTLDGYSLTEILSSATIKADSIIIS